MIILLEWKQEKKLRNMFLYLTAPILRHNHLYVMLQTKRDPTHSAAALQTQSADDLHLRNNTIMAKPVTTFRSEEWWSMRSACWAVMPLLSVERLLLFAEGNAVIYCAWFCGVCGGKRHGQFQQSWRVSFCQAHTPVGFVWPRNPLRAHPAEPTVCQSPVM